MRRIISLLFVFTFVLILTAVFQETAGFQTAVYSQSIPANAIHLNLEPIEGFDPTAVDDEIVPGNSCADAKNVAIITGVGGGETYVGGLSTDPTDPNLSSCTWGTPLGNQGFHTAWYQFTAPYAGMVTVTTRGSNYDTIVSAFTGSCGALTIASCNDDYTGLTSQITFPIKANTTYYLEVADWWEDVQVQPKLNLAAWLHSIDSQWEVMNTLPSQLSRHATAIEGANIYVIGGQTGINTQASAEVYKLDTNSGNWTTLINNMPIPGYANTTAAYQEYEDDGQIYGKIYIPGGYSGLSSISNIHRVYNVKGPDTGLWETDTAIGGTPLAWSQAVPIHNGYYLTGGSDYADNTLPPAATNPPTSTITVSDRLLFYRTTSKKWETKASMQAPRFAHVADQLHDGRICVAGGLEMSEGGQPSLVSTNECFTLANGWSSIGNMNELRFAAASAVGADGRWYVFGGMTVNDGATIPAVTTEVYNPDTNIWTSLPPRYNLGRLDLQLDDNVPNRTWPVGAAVGGYVWAIGGNLLENGATIHLAERLKTYPQYNILTYLPIITSPRDTSSFSTMATAHPIFLSSPQWNNFDEQEFHHVYYFDVYSTGDTFVEMTGIAAGNDYTLFLYNDNKRLLSISENPGASDETIQRTLAAGRYYVMVDGGYVRINQDTSYRLIVQR